jgi:multicomponent Na+:H+ antiporter subunit B
VKPRLRRTIFLAGASVLAPILVWGLTGLPRFGDYSARYGLTLNRVEVRERRATDVVTSVVFDYRGADTMGEEFILFAAVAGILVLLRRTRQEEERIPSLQAEPGSIVASESVRAIGIVLVPLIALFGLVLMSHGHLTPGGGFQGGATVSSAWSLVFLAFGYASFRRVSPIPRFDLAEGAGVAAYPIIGALGILAGASFLQNVLPLGHPGDLLSAGIMPVLNLAVGLAVAAGFVLILSEFLEQALALRVRGSA